MSDLRPRRDSPREQVRERIRGLYGIACADASGGDPMRLVHALLAGGCRLVQVRCKGWSDEELLRVSREAVLACREVGATLIVNDRAEVAAAADADGVHVGQLDEAGELVRRALGSTRIIGRSTHAPEVLVQARAHADYVAFGPVYPTQRLSWAKPLQGLQKLVEARRHAGDTPLVAIGGINASRLAAVRATGVDSWAVIGAVAEADDPVAATRVLLG